jgi:CRISPR-associated endonuclease/helicase Cas3
MKTLFAKSTGETLAAHTAWCLKAARALLDLLPFPEEERKKIAADVLLAVALHDVGKAASGFQRVLLGEQKSWNGKRHEILSAALASSLPGISPAVLMAIITHHKSLPPDGITDDGIDGLPIEQIPFDGNSTPIWEEMAAEWKENELLFKNEWAKICKVLGRADLADIIPNLSSLALDRAWINRSIGKKGQRRAIPFAERYHASLIRGLTIAADHLGSAHHLPPSTPDLRYYSVLKQKARPFQTAISDVDGSAILRAPTGSGKTEASLLWAQRNQKPNGRLFYILPYTASINAMYRRLGPGVSGSQPGIFGSDIVGLLHSRATASLYTILEANEDPCSQLARQENARVLSSLAREMWFPIRVCTPHQILRYMLRGKGWETMLAEFPNACFIFDEVHAYDPRIVGLTLAAARLADRWGARNLFLSATLPMFLERLIKNALGEIPTINPEENQEKDREILHRKRHSLTVQAGTLLDHLTEIIGAVKLERSTLIVCNHVRTAQEVFREIKARFGKDAILLHSLFNQEDRNRIEKMIIEGPLPRVLIATQVVEVSLDVDFDQAFLEPAPIDAIVQRMGRVNRAGRRPPAKVVIFTDQINQYHIYCKCRGESHESNCRVRRSIEALYSIANPVSENDLIDLANHVYSNGYQDEDRLAFMEGLGHEDISEFYERLLAGAHQDWVEHIIESTDNRVEVLPECLIDKYEARRQQGLWIEANALLVPIRAGQKFKAMKENSLIYYKNLREFIIFSDYSSQIGLQLDHKMCNIIE